MTTPDIAPAPPGIPTALKAIRNGSGSVLVTFTPPVNAEDGRPDEVGSYTVICSNGFRATGQNSPIAIGGLTNGNSYTFSVFATNGQGESRVSEKTEPITVAEPPQPPTLVVASVADASSSVTFEAPTATGGIPVGGYVVTAHNMIVEANGGQKEFGYGSPVVVSNLVNGEAYTFTVQAVNDVGESSPSIASPMVIPLAGAVEPPPPPLENAAAYQTDKYLHVLQLEAELREATGVTANTVWIRNSSENPDDWAGTLYVVPADLDEATVHAVLDNHVPDSSYGVPESTRAFNGVRQKVVDNPDVTLSDEELSSAVKGMLLRMNVN